MRLLRNLSRWRGTPLIRAVAAAVVAVVLAAMSAVPAVAAGPAADYTTIDAPRPLDPFAIGSIATGINDRGEVVVPEPLIKLNPPRETSRAPAVSCRCRRGG
jgi:hypothetical protein